MPSIEQALKVAESVSRKSGKPNLRVMPQWCLRVRHRKSTCNRCIDACPHGAICIDAGTITIDKEKCTSCGACTSACPTQALETVGPTYSQLIAQIEEVASFSERLAFCCSQAAASSESDQRFIDVPCLACLDAALYTHAAINGIAAIALLDGNCSECPNSACQPLIQQHLQEAEGVAETFQLKTSITRHTIAADSKDFAPQQGRRTMFSQLATEAKQATITAAATMLELDEPAPTPTLAETLLGENGTIQKQVPQRTSMLVEDLYVNGRQAESNNTTPLFGQVTIDETKCKHCGMCAYFCPTGALVHQGSTMQRSVMGLAHLPSEDTYHEFRACDCVKCGTCAELCPNGAITVTDADAAALLDLEPQILS